MKPKILLGLTTTSNSNWREKIEEIKKYQIKDIALFLTGIDKKERQELYRLLKKTNINSIFHIHLRHDFEVDEMDYLVKQYKVKAFNIHSKNSYYSFKNFPEKYKSITYIENTLTIPREKELQNYAGLCVDFSHWEVLKVLHRLKYSKLKKLVKNNKVGCSHVSVVAYYFKIFPFDQHWAKNNHDFDYLKKYREYLPEYISLELENSFVEQVRYKNYIESNIL